ncbi:MAG: hypothetical protein OEU54_13405 [Gemmatimonadota bacterium]|nr:hypothetical protein [Gemmatimonadota bacterium]
MTTRGILLLGHIFGFVLWFGVTFTVSLISARAKRTGDRTVMAFAYRSSQGMLKGPGLIGAILAIVCGFGLTGVMEYGYFEPWPNHWMFQMQLMGVLAFLAMILLQLPNAERLARAAEASAAADEDSEAFVSFHKRHALISSVIGLMLLVALVLGSLKPV